MGDWEELVNGRAWTGVDESRLRSNMDTYSAKEMAPLLDRTEYSIHCKMLQLRRGPSKAEVSVQRVMDLAEKRRA